MKQTRFRLDAIGTTLVILLAAVSDVRASAILDQQQTSVDSGLSARTLPGYVVWQSFTAGITGSLTTIEMGFYNNMVGDGLLRIFAGDGTAGPLLQSLSVPVLGISRPDVTWNTWSVNVPISSGNQYTFSFTPNPATLPDPYVVALRSLDPYSGGFFGVDDPAGTYRTDFDAVFRTYVTPVPEPSVTMLAVAACVALWSRRRRFESYINW